MQGWKGKMHNEIDFFFPLHVHVDYIICFHDHSKIE